MYRVTTTLLSLALFTVTPLLANPAPEAAPAPHVTVPTPPQLVPFVALEGTWAGTVTHTHHSPEGTTEETEVTYEVTAGGTAVLEKIFEGSDQEMVSVFHMDGDHLILTHYCALGNQPKLQATAPPADGKVTFDFVSGGNMKSTDEPHIHSAAFTIVGPDHIQSHWIMHAGGKPAGFAKMDLHRKK